MKAQSKSQPPSKDEDSRSYKDYAADRRERAGKEDKDKEKEEDKEAEKEEENSILDDKAVAIKAAKAEKKFDKMFKIKKSSTVDGSTGGTAVKPHPEGSVEYWNQIREGLGIKKLKG